MTHFLSTVNYAYRPAHSRFLRTVDLIHTLKNETYNQFLLTNAGELCRYIRHRPSIDEEIWRCWSISFGVVCFMSLCWICLWPLQVGDNTVSESIARHCFQKFRSGGLCLCDKYQRASHRSWVVRHWMRPETGTTKPFVSFCRTIPSHWWNRLHMCRIGKAYNLSKWKPHTLLYGNKKKRLMARFSLLCWHRNIPIFGWVLTSDEK